MDASSTWRVPVEGGLPIRYWDGEYVVYNPLTGNTHVLDIVTGEVLKLIMSARPTRRDLCRHVATFLEVPDDSSTAVEVEQILAALDGLGLIEPIEAC